MTQPNDIEFNNSAIFTVSNEIYTNEFEVSIFKVWLLPPDRVTETLLSL